jgi:hypothetical protein
LQNESEILEDLSDSERFKADNLTCGNLTDTVTLVLKASVSDTTAVSEERAEAKETLEHSTWNTT